MRWNHLVHTVGLVLLVISGPLAITAAVSWGYGDGDAGAFLITAGITAVLGGLALRLTRVRPDLSIREGYAVVSLSWGAIGLIGALPYLLTGTITDPVAAIFESVSGFTTTGATVFSDIEALPHGILLWRSITQWLGGMGIILLGVAILPFLGVGGMHLYRAEVPGPTTERLTPRIAQTAKVLWYVYGGLTLALAGLLLVGGMGPFDAANHALTTMPTGGFSTKNASIAVFDSAWVQWVVIFFMYLAGVNFVLHLRAVTRRPGPSAYATSAEWRFYTGAILIASAVILIPVLRQGGYMELGIGRAIRDVVFQVVSLTTTTGYVSADYGLWPLGTQLLLVGMMFMGGMAGSTGGGIKVMRIHILFKQAAAELRRSLHPRAVVVTRLGARAIEIPILLNILGFVLLFLAIFAAGVLALTFLGHDLSTAVGAAVATLANIGPGIGDVGPVDNFGWMDPWSHGLLVVLMIVGRLEIFTVLLLLHPGLWRR